MQVKTITKDIFLKALEWRNKNIETLRTPFFLTKEMQEEYYYKMICNRQSNVRFFSIPAYDAVSGLINIEWENSIAELSVITKERLGIIPATRILLRYAFKNLNLNNVYAEVYECNDLIEEWMRFTAKTNAYSTRLPNKKFYNGKFHDSVYINFERSLFLEYISTL
jgi:hypothetical protein